MTVLHGGVCHRTLTPHKGGNKMKEKKKNVAYFRLPNLFCLKKIHKTTF